jgi:hypothetical protein
MLDTILKPVERLLDKWVPDADTKVKLAHDIATMAERHAQEIALAQIEVNKAEAASTSLFKGGWRPFIGWTCGTAFAYHFVLQPVLVFALVAFGQPVPDLPKFEMDALMTVLFGMLGLGGLRTFEKFKGVSK